MSRFHLLLVLSFVSVFVPLTMRIKFGTYLWTPATNNSVSSEIWRSDEQNGDKDLILRSTSKTGIKTILIFNAMEYFGSLRFEGCEETRCELERPRKGNSSVDGVDAVLFHFPNRMKPQAIPKKPPGQVWVFHGREGPLHSYNCHMWKRCVNWTMTVRRDSDIYRGVYGKVRPRTHPLSNSFTDIVKGKSKLVAWFVSRLARISGRLLYANELQKYINVDIYGRQGTMDCSKKHTSTCAETLNTTYKFYLSFENTFCRDYVTEKAFKIFPLNVVPIVRGLANYKMFFPPGSYIDTSDFSNIKELADYLKYLDSNDTAYIEYLDSINKWEYFNHFNDTHFPTNDNSVLCDLCKRLHKNDEQDMRVYDNFQNWWNKIKDEKWNPKGRGDLTRTDYGEMCELPKDVNITYDV